MDLKLLQSEKAPSPITITESGMSIDVKPVHDEKAPIPMTLTELGKETLVKNSHITQRPTGIVFTQSPKIIFFNLLSLPKRRGALQFMALKFTVVIFVSNVKAPSPIVVTESGIVKCVKPVQKAKANFPMVLSERGKIMEVNPLHNKKA